MSPSALTSIYIPRITFQDTNVVGNVYFLTFFRWQAECRDHWLRDTRPELWKEIRSGERQLLVTHWSTRFEDPFGATIGDEITMTSTFNEIDYDCILATTEVIRKNDYGPVRIASSTMRFTPRPKLDPQHNDHPTGACYSYNSPPPSSHELNVLDLMSWQGKCRELFIADHAADTLRQIAKQELILQTTNASFDLVCMPPFPLNQVQLEMRLETLQCGKMGVRYDYFADRPNGTALRFAKGIQKMSCKYNNNGEVAPSPFPVDLLVALRQFTESKHLLNKIEDIMNFSFAHQRDLTTSLSRSNN